ncbi:MAG: hypothetical protein ACFNNB_01360 [Candidatus Saccharimonas sp.]
MPECRQLHTVHSEETKKGTGFTRTVQSLSPDEIILTSESDSQLEVTGTSHPAPI